MERQRNLVAGGFGRRGGPSVQAPPNRARPAPSPPAAAPGSPASRERPVDLVTFVFVALLGLICLDALLSGTSLITPISPVLVNVMRGIGFVLGIPLGLLVAFSPALSIGLVRK